MWMERSCISTSPRTHLMLLPLFPLTSGFGQKLISSWVDILSRCSATHLTSRYHYCYYFYCYYYKEGYTLRWTSASCTGSGQSYCFHNIPNTRIVLTEVAQAKFCLSIFKEKGEERSSVLSKSLSGDSTYKTAMYVSLYRNCFHRSFQEHSPVRVELLPSAAFGSWVNNEWSSHTFRTVFDNFPNIEIAKNEYNLRCEKGSTVKLRFC